MWVGRNEYHVPPQAGKGKMQNAECRMQKSEDLDLSFCILHSAFCIFLFCAMDHQTIPSQTPSLVPMNRLLLCAALCVLSLPGALLAGSVDDLDREYGLPEAKIGAPVGAFSGLKLVEDSGRWLTYVPTAEKLKYAGFPVTGMKFNFFKGKLYSINVEVEGRRETRGILKYLEKAFGARPHAREAPVAQDGYRARGARVVQQEGLPSL